MIVEELERHLHSNKAEDDCHGVAQVMELLDKPTKNKRDNTHPFRCEKPKVQHVLGKTHVRFCVHDVLQCPFPSPSPFTFPFPFTFPPLAGSHTHTFWQGRACLCVPSSHESLMEPSKWPRIPNLAHLAKSM